MPRWLLSIRIIIWLILVVIIGWLIWQDAMVSGLLRDQYTFSRPATHVLTLAPKNRISEIRYQSGDAYQTLTDDPIYFDEEGEYSWVRIADVSSSDRYLRESSEKLSVLGKSLSVPLEPGRLFVSIAGTVGKPIITKIKCCIHDGFVYFKNMKVNNEYLYYIFIGEQAYLGLGKWGTQLNLNTETIGLITIPLPDDKEQTKIVQYLDKETSKIDQIISVVSHFKRNRRLQTHIVGVDTMFRYLRLK